MRLGPLGLAGRSVPSHPSCTKEGVRQVKRPLLAAHQRLVQLAHVTNSKVSATQPSPGDVTRPHAFPSLLVFHFVTFEREKSVVARSTALRFVLGVTLTAFHVLITLFFRQTQLLSTMYIRDNKRKPRRRKRRQTNQEATTVEGGVGTSGRILR